MLFLRNSSNRDGDGKWQTVKTATGKSVDVEVQPTVEGKPNEFKSECS